MVRPVSAGRGKGQKHWNREWREWARIKGGRKALDWWVSPMRDSTPRGWQRLFIRAHSRHSRFQIISSNFADHLPEAAAGLEVGLRFGVFGQGEYAV
jgi:hypothetical protein